MSADAAPLSTSAFIAGISPREKSVWRFSVTLVTGLVGGFIVALIAGAVVFMAYALAAGVFQGGAEAARQKITGLLLGGGSNVTSSLVVMALAVATNGPWAAVIVGVAALVAGRSILSYLTAAPSFRWRLLVCGLVFSFLVIGPVVAIGQLGDPHAPTPPILALSKTLGGRIAYAAACVLLLIPAAAAEEVVFRGWLLRQSAALTRNPVVLMLVNGVLFSAVHMEFAPDPFLTRMLMGAGFVYMTLRLGGIEFSTGAHAANNILIVLFIQPLSLKPTPSSGVSFDSLLQDAFLFFSYVVMTEVVARWAPLRRWTGADATATPAIAAAEHFS
jgi:hypothetical protein